MRLIDADAVIDAFTKLRIEKMQEGKDVSLVWECLDKVMQVPTAQPEQRWVPCSERLPEKEGWYITTVESEKTGKRRIENDLFAIEIALSHGHTPNKFCKDGYRQRTVAWCEFPDPWRGEEHETD